MPGRCWRRTGGAGSRSRSCSGPKGHWPPPSSWGLSWASWHFPVKFDAFIDYGLWGALAYLGAFTIKIVAISVVMTFFWARAGQSTLLAVVMHGLSNDVARVGGLVDGATWQASAISELNLALPFIVLAFVLVPYANRRGWGDLRDLTAG